MLRVPFPEALGHQDFDGFTEQFLPGVAEDRLGLPVEADDAPLVAGDDDGVRRGLQHVAESGLLTLHRGPLLLGMSLATFEAPMMLPSASRTGETVSETSMMRPSFVRRFVS